MLILVSVNLFRKDESAAEIGIPIDRSCVASEGTVKGACDSAVEHHESSPMKARVELFTSVEIKPTKPVGGALTELIETVSLTNFMRR